MVPGFTPFELQRFVSDHYIALLALLLAGLLLLVSFRIDSDKKDD